MKKLLLALAVVFMLYVPASASNTELQGMGGMPVQLTNLDQLIYVYPSVILNLDNEIVVEFGAANRGYTLLKIKSSVLGLSMYQNPGLGAALATNPAIPSTVAGAPSIALPTYVFNAIYGLYLGKTGIGASLTYGSNSTSTEVKTTGGVADKDLSGNGKSYLKLALGATLNAGMPVDVFLSIALPGYSSNPKTYTAPPGLVLANDSYEKLSGMNIGIGARTESDSWIFDLGLAMVDLKAENVNWQDTDADGTAETNILYSSDASTINANLLCGKNIEASKNISMVIGTGLLFATTGSTKDIQNNKIADTTIYGTAANSGITLGLPIYFSAMCKLNDIFSFNAGINKTILNLVYGSAVTVDAATGKVISDKSDTTALTVDSNIAIATCLSAKLGDIDIQWLLNYDLIRTGPFIINGTGDDFGMQVALVYNWK